MSIVSATGGTTVATPGAGSASGAAAGGIETGVAVDEETATPPRGAGSPAEALALVGRAPLAWTVALSIVKALALVGMADAVAGMIAAIAAGEAVSGGWVALAAASALARVVADWASSVVIARAAIAVKSRLRGELIDRIAAGDAAQRTGAGELATLAGTGVDTLDSYLRQVVPSTVGAVVVPLALGARILVADWLSAVVLVVTIPLVPVFMILIGMHTRDRVDEATGTLTRLADHLVELARGLPVLVGLGRVDEQADAMDAIQTAHRRRTRDTLRTAFLSSLALELVASISVAIVAVVLGVRLLHGGVGLDVALIALILAPECFTALRDVGSAFHASQDGRSFLERLRGALARRGMRRYRWVGGIGPDAGWHVLDLAVTRPDRGETLAPVNFDAPTGLVTVIDGESGAGKSTLLAALTGTLPADAVVTGRVDHAPGPIAYAAQTPALFAPTLRAELALVGGAGSAPHRLRRSDLQDGVGIRGRSDHETGTSSCTSDRVDAAGAPVGPADAADAGSDPAGAALAVATELGIAHLLDRAVAELSPGELRRAVVARAFAVADAGARLMVLDEPTAHLDPDAAALVLVGIRRRVAGRAIVVVGHDPAVRALADRSIHLGPAASAPTGSHPLPSRSAQPVSPGSEGIGPVLQATATSEARVSADAVAGSAADAFTTGVTADGATVGAAAPTRWTLRPLARLLPGWRWVGAILLGGVAVLMSLALTAISGWLIVTASTELPIMYLLVAIVGVRFFGLGRAVFRYVERLVTHDAVLVAIGRMRRSVWQGIAQRGAASARLREGGAPVDFLVSLLDDVRDLAPRVVVPTAAALMSVAAVLVTTGFVTPELLPLAAVLLVAGLVAGPLVAVLVDRSAGATRADARAETLRAVAALGTTATQLRPMGLVDRAARQAVAAERELARIDRRTAAAEGAGVAVATLPALLVAALAPAFAIGSGPEVAAFVTVTALLGLAVVDPLTGAVLAVRRALPLGTALGRLAPLAAPVPDARPAHPLAVPAAPLHLDAQRVTAGWPGGPDVLTDVTACALRGRWLVVEGPSGSGKTTLLSVLLGTLAPRAGAIAVDGVRVADVDPDAWRQRVAWTPQEAHVFDSTIRGNLLLARDHDDRPTDAELTAVLDRVGLGALVAASDRGLDTRVGPAGSALSGGERQRLAVARALLNGADVLLLDEPTAHLDAATASAMMADLRRATDDRIVVLVTHKADDVRAADARLRLG